MRRAAKGVAMRVMTTSCMLCWAPQKARRQSDGAVIKGHGVDPTHGISLANALKASANESVLVSIDTPRPSTATAPSGSGVVMMPTIVPAKIASRCQALADTPAGAGATHSATPTPMQIARFFMSAPHLKGFSEGRAAEEDAARTVTCGLRDRALGSTGTAFAGTPDVVSWERIAAIGVRRARGSVGRAIGTTFRCDACAQRPLR